MKEHLAIAISKYQGERRRHGWILLPYSRLDAKNPTLSQTCYLQNLYYYRNPIYP